MRRKIRRRVRSRYAGRQVRGLGWGVSVGNEVLQVLLGDLSVRAALKPSLGGGGEEHRAVRRGRDAVP